MNFFHFLRFFFRENLRCSTPINELEIDDSIDTVCDLTVIERTEISDVCPAIATVGFNTNSSEGNKEE